MDNQINNYKELIAWSAAHHAAKPAFVMRRRIQKEIVSFSQLPELIGKFSAYLASLNVKSGDRVILWGTNSTEYALALLTVFSSGRVSVPIDYRTAHDTVDKIIDQTEPALAIVSKYLDSDFIKSKVTKVIFLEDLLHEISKFEPEEFTAPDPDAVCQIVYTSGTTGTPKGVQLTNRNLVQNAYGLESLIPSLKKYRTVSVLPLSHVFEQVVTLTMGLILGTQITYLSKVNSLQLRRAMQEYKPTYLVLVPQLLNVLLGRIEENIKKEGKQKTVEKILRVSPSMPVWLRRLLFKKVHKSFGGSLEFIGLGGAPLALSSAEKFRLMGFKLLQGYGATEVTAVATFNSNPDSLDNVGYALPGVEIKLSDQKEILVKSETLSTGYFKNPEKTAQVFKDGWYFTGDIGQITQDGRLKILGREAFRLVLKNGENVYVEDLENEILKNSEVKDVAVIGIDDEASDKIHPVFILKQPDTDLDLLVAKINGSLTSKQQILSYSIWPEDDFPRTHTLKINRSKVREFVESQMQGMETIPTTTVLNIPTLESIIAKVAQIDASKIADDMTFASDLKLDSLARAEMMAMIEEEMALSVDAITIEGTTTVGQLRALLADLELTSKNGYFPTWQFNRLWKVVRAIVMFGLIFPLHALFVRIDISKEERARLRNLPSKTLITVNHAGLFDSLVVMRLLGWKAIKTVLLAFAQFWEAKKKAKIVEFVGGFPIDQTGTNLVSSLRVVSDLLEEKKADFIQIAPQGRFDRDGNTPFKEGYKFIARELDLQVINLRIDGYEQIFTPPKGDTRKLTISDVLPKRIGTVKVKIVDDAV